MAKSKSMERKISLLDWLIILAALIMLAMIYIPSSIWREEVRHRSESRERMTIISEAEEFYRELTGSYTTDGDELFQLVEAAMDSLIADTLFLGQQKIKLNGKEIIVNMSKGLDFRIDTTFSYAQVLERSFMDTIYKIAMLNVETDGTDTILVNQMDIRKKKADPFFQKVLGMEVQTRIEDYTDYLRDKYHLIPDLLSCPLTGEPYIFEIDESDPEMHIFTVKSPVPEDYTERRYGIFKYESGRHGEIVGGEQSWAGKN